MPVAIRPRSRSNYWAIWYDESRRVTLDDGSRHIFTGEPAEVAADIDALAQVGVSAVLFSFVRSTLDETLASTERFARDVMPLVGT